MRHISVALRRQGPHGLWSVFARHGLCRSRDEHARHNGRVVRLTGGQAEWLNAFGDKTAVANAFAGLSGDEFAKAYLLNLDVMDKNALDDCVFEIAGISVGDEYIENDTPLILLPQNA